MLLAAAQSHRSCAVRHVVAVQEALGQCGESRQSRCAAETGRYIWPVQEFVEGREMVGVEQGRDWASGRSRLGGGHGA